MKVEFITCTNRHQITDPNITVTNDTSNLINFLENSDLIGYDKETSSLSPFKAIELLDSIGDKENVFVIDKTTVDTSFLNNYSDKTFIGHNIKYDYTVAKRNGFEFNKIYDTMIVEQVLGRGSGRSASLNNTHERRLNKPMLEDKSVRSDFIGAGKNFIFRDKHIRYSGYDIACLFEIREIQLPLITQYGLDFLIFDIEFPLIPILGTAELEGIAINVDRWKELIEENMRNKIEFEREMDKEVHKLLGNNSMFKGGKYSRRRRAQVGEVVDLFGNSNYIQNVNKGNINYASHQQVKDLFKDIEGRVPKAKDTSSYELKDSVSEVALEQYLLDHPDTKMRNFISILLKHKEIVKALSSFGEKFIKHTVPGSGKTSKLGYLNPITNKVHTQYRQASTENGRFASGQKEIGYYNSQQIPKQKKYRECFGLTQQEIDEGYYITTCDLSGAELIILGALSGDQKLIQLQKEDIHSYLATKAFTKIINYILNTFNGKRVYYELHELLKVNKIYKVLLDDQGNPYSGAEAKVIEEDRIKYAIESRSFIVDKKSSKDIRDPFKNVVYGTSYGASANKIAETLSIAKHYGELVLESMEEELPQAFRFLNESSKFGMRHGYIVFNNRTNSRHWFKYALEAKKYGYQLDKGKLGSIARACKNYRISGTQADMIKEAIVDINKYCKENNIDAILLLQVHDELVYKHKDKDFGKKIAELMTTAANRYLNGIEMSADFETLHTWTK